MSIVEIPIGTQAKVRCQVFPDEVDAGGTLQGVVKELTAKVQPKQVAPWAVRVVGESAATFVSVIYHAQSPRGTLVGELKLALHAVPTRPVLCMHDEPGYRKTFETVVSDFGGSLKLKKAPPASSFLEVQTAHVGDRPRVQVVDEAAHRGAAGDPDGHASRCHEVEGGAQGLRRDEGKTERARRDSEPGRCAPLHDVRGDHDPERRLLQVQQLREHVGVRVGTKKKPRSPQSTRSRR